MKKLFLTAVLLASFLGSGSFLFGQGGSRVVETKSLDHDFTASPPTVTFEVYWNFPPTGPRHRDSVWVFVDYAVIGPDGAVGTWTPATLSNPSLSHGALYAPVPLPYRGFYVDGHGFTPTFSSTVTVALNGLTSGTRFNWCAYATDYPPNAEEHAGGYTLHGTPPFLINGSIEEPTRTYDGGCITSLTDATGCPGWLPAPPAISAFTATPDALCHGGTVTLTATATDAAEYSFDGGQSWQSAPTLAVAPPAHDTAYTVHVQSPAGCIATFATAAVTVYPKPSASFTTAPATACAGSSVTLVATGGSSYCFTQMCSECLRNPYATGNDSLPAADCQRPTIRCDAPGTSSSYTLTMPESGEVIVWVKVVDAHGCIDSTSHTVAAAGTPPTLTLMTDNADQTVDEGTAIAPILYTTTDATDATATGLPSDVSGVWSNHTFTISGTPAAAGTYLYTVTTTNNDGCPNATATGTITANMVMPPGAGTKTYTTCGQIWSEPVKIAACDQTSFTNNTTTPYCRSYTYNSIKYFYYNWAYVNANKDTMCPTPWHVPANDEFEYLLNCLGPSETSGKYYPEYSTWGGALAGYAYNALMYQVDAAGRYWSSTPLGEQIAHSLRIESNNAIRDDDTYKRSGFQVRCVR
jgi:uncharacterized protein (TIGR02145 family)